MRGVLYLDDLAAGGQFTTRSVTLTLEGCKAFAAEFDPQPFHLDEAAARESVFGRIAASGWYTAALSMRLLVEGELTIAGGLIGIVAVRNRTLNQHGDPVQIVVVKMLVPRRGA